MIERLLPLMLRAMDICSSIRSQMQVSDTLIKSDLSPVTVADLAVQAFFTSSLAAIEPALPLLGEENQEKHADREIYKRCAGFLQQFQLAVPLEDIEELFLNRTVGNNNDCWILDPIDGTKGYLRNAQYAVALALRSKGRIVLGMVGAPNLKKVKEMSSSRGFVFFAQAGRGAKIYNPETDEFKEIHVSDEIVPARIRVVASFEKEHASQEEEERILKQAGITSEVLRIDSIIKYCLIASGMAELYLRIPHNREYRAKVWDHAAGDLILSEAGGRVSDLYGNFLNYNNGLYLCGNFGILATNGAIHNNLLKNIASAIG